MAGTGDIAEAFFEVPTAPGRLAGVDNFGAPADLGEKYDVMKDAAAVLGEKQAASVSMKLYSCLWSGP